MSTSTFESPELLIIVRHTVVFVVQSTLSVDKQKRNVFAIWDRERRLDRILFGSRTRAVKILGTRTITARAVSQKSKTCREMRLTDAVTRRERAAPGWTRRWAGLCKRAGYLGEASRSMPRCSTPSITLPCRSDGADRVVDFFHGGTRTIHFDERFAW